MSVKKEKRFIIIENCHYCPYAVYGYCTNGIPFCPDPMKLYTTRKELSPDGIIPDFCRLPIMKDNGNE